MRIANFFQTTTEAIERKRWNPYLGISIQNRAFTTEYIREYASWACERAREGAAIVVVDVLQRINNQVLNRDKVPNAIDKAFRKADEVQLRCAEALASLAPEQRSRIVVLDWGDIMDGEFFVHNSQVFRGEFETNPPFRDFLMQLTSRNLGRIVDRLDAVQVETLAQYMLFELPELVTGFVHEGRHYNLNVYPGSISSVCEELARQEFFAAIRERLRFIGPHACIEAYSEVSAI